MLTSWIAIGNSTFKLNKHSLIRKKTVLVKAFLEEFVLKKKENASLTILTSSYHASRAPQEVLDEFIDQYFLSHSHSRRPHKIPIHLLENLSPHALFELYKTSDAFVLATRGEGWGRPIVEAMSMGLPTIATAWGGTTEFLNEENSFPLNPDELIEIEDGAFRGHMWADVNCQQVRQTMRKVFENEIDSKTRGAQARKTMVENYKNVDIATKLVKIVEGLIIKQKDWNLN